MNSRKKKSDMGAEGLQGPCGIAKPWEGHSDRRKQGDERGREGGEEKRSEAEARGGGQTSEPFAVSLSSLQKYLLVMLLFRQLHCLCRALPSMF